MWQTLVSIIACFLALSVDGRVTFTTSEVIDKIDLQGKETTTFNCKTGCKVFSPTRNDNLVILNPTGNELKTLTQLANQAVGEFYELPASDTAYILKNKNTQNTNPSFTLYVVQKGAPNYNTKVVCVNGASQLTLTTVTSSMVTILSSSGAVRISDFKGDYSNGLPTVHATGFDQIGSASCRPVYDAVSQKSLLNTAVPVHSPVVTIDFRSISNTKSALVSGDAYTGTTTNKDSSAVYTSPGYVGCENTGDSLYTDLSGLTSISNSFALSDSNGLTATVNGDYSIAKEADAISLTINGDVQKLFGTKPISQTYNANSFKIAIGWEKKENSKDRFAMQIDIISGTDQKQETTTRSGVVLNILTPVLSLLPFLLIR